MTSENKKQKRILKTHKSYEDKVVGGGRKKSNPTPGFLSRFLLYFLVIIFLGTAGYLIFFSGFLAVAKIDIDGGEDARRDYIRNLIDSKLEGKYLNVIDRNNIVLFSRRNVKKEIADQFKIIKKITIRKKFPDSLNILIEEKNVPMIISSAGKKWVIDDDGYAFDEAEENYAYMGKSNIPVIFDKSDKNFLLGQIILNQDYIKFIADFRRLSEDELEIELEKEIQVPNISSGDIRMKTKEGWMILMDENLGAQKEKEMLQVVLENKIEKEKRPNLEYIDIRIANKVYYKFKGDVSEEVLENKSETALQPPAVEKKEDTKKTKKKD